MRLLRIARFGQLNWGRSICALLLLFAATLIASPAQTVTTIHRFISYTGSGPEALVQATNGSLYGATRFGGHYCEGPFDNGCGTLFKITLSGKVTSLHDFCETVGHCLDGAQPYSAMIQATNGNLYGMTSQYRAQGGQPGTVFKITPNGEFTLLHSFCVVNGPDGEYCLDGSFPLGGLVQAVNGNFYGTTTWGGTNCSYNGCGTIFTLTPSGTLTVLYSFCAQTNCVDGINPQVAPVQAIDGNFYGTTLRGGANCISNGGCGTVYKMTPSGTVTTLYSFCSQSGCADGNGPTALIQDADGSFYGATTSGGNSTACTSGCGTIFRITASGVLTTLHSFYDKDGNSPSVPMQASDGDLYGTTSAGGAYDQGTIYKLAGSKLTTLYSFCSESTCPDGSAPDGLIQDTNGYFYGATLSGGGTSNICGGGCGTVYSLSVGLGPFIETQTTTGKEGATVKILGTNLTGATSVTFNGTAVVFTVVSSSEITATVPVGATTGEVQVTTPGGTLSSNQKFRVIT